MASSSGSSKHGRDFQKSGMANSKGLTIGETKSRPDRREGSLTALAMFGVDGSEESSRTEDTDTLRVLVDKGGGGDDNPMAASWLTMILRVSSFLLGSLELSSDIMLLHEIDRECRLLRAWVLLAEVADKSGEFGRVLGSL